MVCPSNTCKIGIEYEGDIPLAPSPAEHASTPIQDRENVRVFCSVRVYEAHTLTAICLYPATLSM